LCFNIINITTFINKDVFAIIIGKPFKLLSSKNPIP
jgi:hypothetical protein